MKKLIVLFLIAALMVPVFAVNAAAPKTETVNAVWNFGYVGSSTNTNATNKINANGNNYSYTDLIDMGPAGSTITFTNPNLGYASKSAYVISFWTDENTLDTSAKNTCGFGNGSGADANKYSFTATEDCLVRITEQSGQLSENHLIDPPAVMIGDKEVNTEWAWGYVASKVHSTKPNEIVANGNNYSYTLLPIELKKGETISFVSTDYVTTSQNLAIFSFWKLNDGADKTKPDSYTLLDSIGANETTKFTAEVKAGEGCQTVTYTSQKDNEKIRFCYQSGQKKDTPFEGTRPTITLTQVVKEEPKPETGDTALIIAAISMVALAGAVICKRKRV